MSARGLAAALVVVLVAALTGPAACAGKAPLSPERRVLREQRVRELLRAGTASLRSSELDRAEASFLVARELSPRDPRVLDGLGCVEWRRRNEKLAAYYFRRAFEENAEYDRPLAHLALVAEGRGHHRAARELLRRAIELNPLSFRSRNDLAAVLLRLARGGPPSDDAYRELLRAFELAGPEDPVVRHNLGAAQPP